MDILRRFFPLPPPRASSFSDRAGRAWIAYSQGDHKLYFWRTRKGVEVDFVVYGVGGFWAIEVKNATRVRPQDLRALRAFREDYPEAEALLLYRGSERLRIEGIWFLPERNSSVRYGRIKGSSRPPQARESSSG